MAMRPYVAVAALAVFCGSVAWSTAAAAPRKAPRADSKIAQRSAASAEGRQKANAANPAKSPEQRIKARSIRKLRAEAAAATRPRSQKKLLRELRSVRRAPIAATAIGRPARTNASLGATLLTEDFNAGIPAGWTVL